MLSDISRIICNVCQSFCVPILFVVHTLMIYIYTYIYTYSIIEHKEMNFQAERLKPTVKIWMTKDPDKKYKKRFKLLDCNGVWLTERSGQT